MDQIIITLNGEKTQTKATDILRLLESLKLQPTDVIVELNGTVLHKNEFPSTKITPQDNIEILRFIGGG
ncbi:MAG: sulfur carrier protein ThiS [Candidatus Marinamargulisbacteria bacterium]